jgi:DNA (cytosine-5)-methyltransferase 1
MVKRLVPRVACIENVPGILSMRRSDGTLVMDSIARAFKTLGYSVGYRLLNAADFGDPQVRMRVVIFGWKQGGIPKFEKTHDKLGKDGLPRWLTGRDAIGDLENRGEDEAWSHVFARHGSEVTERIRCTPIGGMAAVSYNEGYYRNPPGLPCRTLRGGCWPIHYLHDRMITPREGARIQGFTDDFIFVGNKSEVMLQIGNAVPPPLAKAVGLAVLGMLGTRKPQ